MNYIEYECKVKIKTDLDDSLFNLIKSRVYELIKGTDFEQMVTLF